MAAVASQHLWRRREQPYVVPNSCRSGQWQGNEDSGRIARLGIAAVIFESIPWPQAQGAMVHDIAFALIETFAR